MIFLKGRRSHMGEYSLPPFFSTGDKDSFAMKTLQKRKPSIIDQVIQANEFNDAQKKGLISFKHELIRGVVKDPFKDSPFRIDALDEESVRMWKKALVPYAGKPWLDIPFYFAEALLYMRILTDSGYFASGSPTYLLDPYQAFKNRELFSEEGGLRRGRMVTGSLKTLGNSRDKLETLIYNSLWGNRVDLSLYKIAESSRSRTIAERGENLLIDHAPELVDLITDAVRIDMVLDNAGQELVCDLITARHILSSGAQKTVHLHVKKYPLYVSDAMIKDLEMTVTALRDDWDELLSDVGKDLLRFEKEKRLLIHDHYFWNGPLHYDELPRDLVQEFSASDIVVFKGDVNYRRLVFDRRWDAWKNMEEITGYFPTTFATLRTMKSESVVDIEEEQVVRLTAEDPQWMVNGERGIIRVVEKVKIKPQQNRS
jgi:hypothetical protein